MKSIISKILTFIIIILACLFSVSSLIPAYAANPACDPSVAEDVRKANGCPEFNTGDKLPSLVTTILNSVIGISGLIAVIFIIIGGISYMTSTGDTGKTKKAKDTILYAVIGLAICALAFVIVNWVIGVIN